MQQPVQCHVLVDQDDDPEGHLKRTLGVLVPEELLREQGALQQALATQEEAWLEAQEALETLAAELDLDP